MFLHHFYIFPYSVPSLKCFSQTKSLSFAFPNLLPVLLTWKMSKQLQYLAAGRTKGLQRGRSRKTQKKRMQYLSTLSTLMFILIC